MTTDFKHVRDMSDAERKAAWVELTRERPAVAGNPADVAHAKPAFTLTGRERDAALRALGVHVEAMNNSEWRR
jgi:hypothetical protein